MTVYRQAAIRLQDVANPSYMPAHEGEKWNPQRVTVAVNIRESAVESLAARGQLDHCQKRAADEFRRYWEMMGGAGAQAIDYTKEPVDGGGHRETLTERLLGAGKELNHCRELLGWRNYALVVKVCGEGKPFSALASGRRERDTLADNLRASLDDLADRWKLR